ncbi:MAG TPA: thiol:disulfide interchange protein DsbA/DsbL [Steroidobacteraceae bacterium]|jgi:thiol:disulfide interchange protein DsbA|nr:thiol:disulfide interchange protein DsbA/DsbL [Steroidobacteraceae bacterium]
MSRLLALTALLALCLPAGSCSRQETPPVPATPSGAASAAPANTPAATPAPGAAAPAQSEAELARAAQESADGAVNEKPESSDASLERMAALPPDAQLPAGRWKPGVNYDPVVPGQPTSVAPGKVEVLEVLWLGCPHCYALEPGVKAWLKTKPAYIEFVRVPVIWGPVHRAHARLFYTLKALGRPDLIDKAFDTIQREHNPLIGSTDEESLKMEQAWAVQQGVSAADFASAYDSLAVHTDLARAEELTQRYRVQGVPLMIVNGKYTTEVSKAGNPANLFQLIDDLAASEHRH